MENIKHDFIKNNILLKNIDFDLNISKESEIEEKSEFDMNNWDKNIAYNKESKNTLKEYIYLFNVDTGKA